jgi:hypothetical protein
VLLRSTRLPAILLVALVPLACVVWPKGAGPDAAPMPLAEALQRCDRGEAMLVDLRSARGYAAGHIPGAVNIGADAIEGRAAGIRRMDRMPILYCG